MRLRRGWQRDNYHAANHLGRTLGHRNSARLPAAWLFQQDVRRLKEGRYGGKHRSLSRHIFGPFGIISGPFIGAFVGELLNDANSTERALKVACGSLLSFFTGTGLKLIVGGFIFYYIAKDVISIVGDTL